MIDIFILPFGSIQPLPGFVCSRFSNRTEPNRTEPNRTEPNPTEPNRTERNRHGVKGLTHKNPYMTLLQDYMEAFFPHSGSRCVFSFYF